MQLMCYTENIDGIRQRFRLSRAIWQKGRQSMEIISLYGTLYYEKSIFKGSYRGMNFWIQKGGEEDTPVLTATAWKGPYNFDSTKEEKFSKDFPFSQEGIDMADRWLTEQQKILV